MDPLFSDADNAAIDEALGRVEFAIGDSTAFGFLDQADVPVLPGEEARQNDTLILGRLRTGALAGLVVGAAITANGTAYTVRETRLIDDGSYTAFQLASA